MYNDQKLFLPQKYDIIFEKNFSLLIFKLQTKL